MKLHLGCGKRYIPGFVHVDLVDLNHIDYRHAVDNLPMFQDDSVELIYASHVFEYFDRQEAALRVLTEWRRVLRTGGILRLAVPDFPALMKVYELSGDLNKILGPLYGRWIVECGRGGDVRPSITKRSMTLIPWPSFSRRMVSLMCIGTTGVRRFIRTTMTTARRIIRTWIRKTGF